MSSLSEFADSGRSSCTRPVRAPEKSSAFSQTCSLLSQYLKEKGSLGDLSLGINGNGKPEIFRQTGPTTTTPIMNFFPVVKKTGELSGVSSPNAFPLASMDLFPQQSGFASKEEVPNKVDSSANKSEQETAQMTIFYGGKVIVFNDFPAEKAKEVMLLASKESSQRPTTFASMPVQNPIEPINLVPASANVVSNFGNRIQERPQQTPQPRVTEIPIARKASLTRFLEKRKDRITARAPYQSSNFSAYPPKSAESKSWLGLAAQSPI